MDTEPAGRFCARGHRNSPEARFCIACGDPLYTAAPAPAPERRPIRALPEMPTNDPASEPGTPGTSPAPPAVPARRGLRRGWIFAAVGLLVVLGAGAVAVNALGLGSGPELRGLFVLFDTDGSVEGNWDDCQGTGGYSDFSPGMNVSIRGRNDEIVGSGDVVSVTEDLLPEIVEMDWTADELVGLDETSDRDAAVKELRELLESAEGYGCWLFIRAELEPSDYYSIEVGSRGDLDYSREDLAAEHYIVSMSLGL